MVAKVAVKYGELKLNALTLGYEGKTPKIVTVRLNETALNVRMESKDKEVLVKFDRPIEVSSDGILEVILSGSSLPTRPAHATYTGRFPCP